MLVRCVSQQAGLSRSDRTMRVVRVDVGGQALVGVRFPAQLLQDVVAMMESIRAAAALAALGQVGGSPGALHV